MNLYIMRGFELFDSHNRRIAITRGEDIYDGNNLCIAPIRGNFLFDSKNRKTMTVRSGNIYDVANVRIASLSDVQKSIESVPAGMHSVALWYCSLNRIGLM